MKSLRLVLLGAVAVTAACVSKREAPPQPESQPPVRQPQYVPAPPAPPPPPVGWRDVPLTPGNWYYRGEGAAARALFGSPNAEALFEVRCDLSSRSVMLSRYGAVTGNVMTIRTTETARSLPATAQPQPVASASATVPADDRLLDAVAFSRGRFTVEVSGAAMLVIPAWPEAARVVEDCRA